MALLSRVSQIASEVVEVMMNNVSRVANGVFVIDRLRGVMSGGWFYYY